MAGSEPGVLASAEPDLGVACSPCTSCGPEDGSWAPDAVMWPGAAACDSGAVVTYGLGRRDEGELLAGSGMGGPSSAGADLDGNSSPRAGCGPPNGDLEPDADLEPFLVRS